MINLLDFLKTKDTLSIEEMFFGENYDDDIWGDKKPITVDSSNVLIDGNHRVYKLLKEKGPKHKIEVDKWIIPQWLVALCLTTLAFIRWAVVKAKALYTPRT